MNRGNEACFCAGTICVLLWYLFGVFCCYTCTYRSKLRGLFSLPGDQCGDYCIHCWCTYCALCQEYRELKNRGLDPSMGEFPPLYHHPSNSHILWIQSSTNRIRVVSGWWYTIPVLQICPSPMFRMVFPSFLWSNNDWSNVYNLFIFVNGVRIKVGSRTSKRCSSRSRSLFRRFRWEWCVNSGILSTLQLRSMSHPIMQCSSLLSVMPSSCISNLLYYQIGYTVYLSN